MMVFISDFERVKNLDRNLGYKEVDNNWER